MKVVEKLILILNHVFSCSLMLLIIDCMSTVQTNRSIEFCSWKLDSAEQNYMITLRMSFSV